MIGLLQRVRFARVEIQQQIIAEIDTGLLVLVGVEKSDTPSNSDKLLHRLLGYRVFPDADGKMNLSLTDINGGLLLVPQFTLVADTSKGMRPGFSAAASPEKGRVIFEELVAKAREEFAHVCSGEFGKDMQVSLLNDGPVTISIRT